jgi:L-amino acid N-acyltransferase YncA
LDIDLKSFVYKNGCGLVEFAFSEDESILMGKCVFNITNIELKDPHAKELVSFVKGLRETLQSITEDVVISMRLSSHQTIEIDTLQAAGFRFVELSLHPELHDLQERSIPPTDLKIISGDDVNLDAMVRIAESSFKVSRYHRDSRVPAGFADRRFGHWVRDAALSEHKSILQIQDADDVIVGIFVTRSEKGNQSYWELTGLASEHVGKSLGRAAWASVMRYEQARGVQVIRTTISAENLPVLGLLTGLNFRFASSSVALHFANFGTVR